MNFHIRSIDALRNAFKRLSNQPVPENGWLVTVKPYEKEHTDGQRALLWVTWREIADHIAESTGQRFTDQDVHDFCLGKVFGWDDVEIAGKRISRPHRTITKPKRMSKEHMAEVIMATDQLAAEYGVPVKVYQGNW